MYQGTTPALLLRVKGKDLTGCNVFASIKAGMRVITKTGSDLEMDTDDDDTLVLCHLTQEDTLPLSEGEADVQVRFINSDGVAEATSKAKITIESVIYKKVIEYGDGEET